MGYQIGHAKYSFTEMYDSLNEKKKFNTGTRPDDLNDDDLMDFIDFLQGVKPASSNKDQHATALKAAKAEMKKRGFNESADNKKLHADAVKIAKDALKKIDKLWGKSDSKDVGMALEQLKQRIDGWLKGYGPMHVQEAKMKMPEGSIVANKKTGVEFKVIENNGQGGIYCQPLNKKSGGTWFRETDMTLLKDKSEGSTENAKKTLDAIIGHLEKRKSSGADVLGATGRSMLKMGTGIAASYKEEGSFSPDQAKWIWKTSVALFKK